MDIIRGLRSFFRQLHQRVGLPYLQTQESSLSWRLGEKHGLIVSEWRHGSNEGAKDS